jgi:response regulator NasT
VTTPLRNADNQSPALRVLLIDDGAHRVAVIRDELTRQGHLVVGVVDQALLIHDCVLRLQPDVVIVDAESPSRDTLENLATMSSTSPRPVVVFAEDASHEPMQQALKAGVSAYVIAGLDPTAPDAGAAGGHRPLRAGPRCCAASSTPRRRSCRSAS